MDYAYWTNIMNNEEGIFASHCKKYNETQRISLMLLVKRQKHAWILGPNKQNIIIINFAIK